MVESEWYPSYRNALVSLLLSLLLLLLLVVVVVVVVLVKNI